MQRLNCAACLITLNRLIRKIWTLNSVALLKVYFDDARWMIKVDKTTYWMNRIVLFISQRLSWDSWFFFTSGCAIKLIWCPFNACLLFQKNNSFPRLKFMKKMLSTAIFKYDITTSKLYRQSLSFYALFNLKFIIRVNNTVYWICDQRKQFKCNSNFISLNRSNHIVKRCSWYVCFARKKNQWNQHQFCASFSLIPLQAFYKNVNIAQSALTMNAMSRSFSIFFLIYKKRSCRCQSYRVFIYWLSSKKGFFMHL